MNISTTTAATADQEEAETCLLRVQDDAQYLLLALRNVLYSTLEVLYLSGGEGKRAD